MNKLISFNLALLLISLFSCTDKMNINNLTHDIHETETISVENALSNLVSFIEQHNQLTTKSTERIAFEISDIEVFGGKQLSQKTKSSNFNLPDTLIYIANLKNGFAVLSANTKLNIDEVLCFTESGEFHNSDLIEAYNELNSEIVNKNLGEKTVAYLILSAITNGYKLQIDSEIETKAEPSGMKYGPFLKTKWTQTSNASYITPFNKYIPNNTAAGCVAIAVAQIMQYNKKPANPVFDGVACQWHKMDSVANYSNPYNYAYVNNNVSTEAKDQVAHFIYEIGKKYNCYVRWDNGSWAVADGAQRTLKNYGYKNVDKRTGFASGDKKKVTAQLRAGRPVYMGGCPKGSLNNGHAWVIDGICGNYYHINWGWNGIHDGYYSIGVFNTAARYGKDNLIDQNIGNSNEHSNFTWTYRIVLYS